MGKILERKKYNHIISKSLKNVIVFTVSIKIKKMKLENIQTQLITFYVKQKNYQCLPML